MNKKVNFFKNELHNLEKIANYIKPSSGNIPELNGLDIFGEVIYLNKIGGGDHIVYVDFNKRYDLQSRIREALELECFAVAKKLELNKTRAGILIADASGHQITDAMLSAMLHQAFLIGVLYELNQNGEVTEMLFENLNTRFYNSSSLSKFISIIYGEISQTGKFRFLNAGHPLPYIYSKKFAKLVKIDFKRMVTVQPIGTLPSKEDIDIRRNFSRLGYKKKYTTNEINLIGSGDILLLYTDGLSEHMNDQEVLYFPEKLEKKLQKISDYSAKEIFFHIKEDLFHFKEPNDDISIIIIKKL